MLLVCISQHRVWPGLLFLAAIASCGGNTDATGGADATPLPTVTSLKISPQDAELVVFNGATVTQEYTVIATLSNDEVLDVTSSAAISVDTIRIGSFLDSTFSTSNVAGGSSIVRATYQGSGAQTSISVMLRAERVAMGAPANSADLFDNGSDDATLAPVLKYPATGAYMPPNIGDFEVHWIGGGSTDLFEVSIKSPYSSLRVFIAGATSGAFTNFTPEEWKVIGESARGATVEVQVRALDTASPSAVGASEVRTVSLTDTDIEGGIYYWAAAGALPEGIYRHDMSRPGEPAEAFYTTNESPKQAGNPQAGRCVACHVISRNGEKMAVTFDGGNGEGTIVDVATRAPLLPIDGSIHWNFAAFEPSGARILTVLNGTMTLRDSASGAAINTVPTGGWATHPDFAPSGDKIAYVASGVMGSRADFSFLGGYLVLQNFEAGAAMWGTPEVLYQPPAGKNAYYPSFSPDGKWILFNQSDARSYSSPNAEVYIIRADGSGTAIRLDSPNAGSGISNSWARWAPFEQTYGSRSETSEPLFWLTFSSIRAFGVRLPAGRPQIWMAPFFPNRATAGQDPSSAAFRLPFQELATSNHISQWTTQVVPIE